VSIVDDMMRLRNAAAQPGPDACRVVVKMDGERLWLCGIRTFTLFRERAFVFPSRHAALRIAMKWLTVPYELENAR
jgi:hypothetical protein